MVYSLRRKIGDRYIETVVGSGYRFVGEETIPRSGAKSVPGDSHIYENHLKQNFQKICVPL